jgi:TIR domain
MNILYISPKGIRKDIFESSDIQGTYDLDTISNSIIKGITTSFDEMKVTKYHFLLELFTIADVFTEVKKFDLCLCDLTTLNSNVSYIAGIAQALGKPVIWISSINSTRAVAFERYRLLTYSDATLIKEFRKALNSEITLVIKNPEKYSSKSPKITKQSKAFISYSHTDKSYLDRLMIHLKPLVKLGMIDVWVDTKIKTGELWRNEIEKALKAANIAILLLSADFMASDFIIDNELPPLLLNAQVSGTKILPVILSPCRFERDISLNQFQAVNAPSKHLSGMSHDKREEIYDKLASDIEFSLKT